MGFSGVKLDLYKHTWQAPIPLKMKVFLWLIQNRKFLTKDNLRRRGWPGDDKCVFL